MTELLNLKKEKSRLKQKIEDFASILENIQKENTVLRQEIRGQALRSGKTSSGLRQ